MRLVSLYTNLTNKVAKSGQEHTMSEVLVVVVKFIASFSLKKYIDPPVMPSNAILASSFQVSENRRRWLNANMSTYAMENRNVKICAGDRPLSIKTLVETKVVPQMATVTNATR